MADKKISALTAAATPLAGTEVLPIVQAGNTVKVSVANLTAGRAIEAFSGVIGGADSSTTFAIKGVTKAVRFETASTGVSLTGVDSTLVSSYQPLTIQGSAIPISIAGVTVGEFNASGNYAPVAGKGIDFSANTHAPGMTSELLDWYEEGTFTPSFTAFGATISHAQQRGSYTRVGRLVTASIYIQVSGVSGSLTDPLFITGLPFASISGTEYGFSASIGVHQFSGATPSAFMGANATAITIYQSGTVSYMFASNLTAGYYLMTITYMTD